MSDSLKSGEVIPMPRRTDSARQEAATERCPVCGDNADQKHKPFCSKRCADVDLGRWLKGYYRIPTDERPEDGNLPPSVEDGGEA